VLDPRPAFVDQPGSIWEAMLSLKDGPARFGRVDGRTASKLDLDRDGLRLTPDEEPRSRYGQALPLCQFDEAPSGFVRNCLDEHGFPIPDIGGLNR
jgi:hypothetical protein